MNWNAASRHLSVALVLGGLGLAAWRDPLLATSLTLILAGALIWWQRDPRKVVRARRVEIVNEFGDTRAELSLKDAGTDLGTSSGALLQLYDWTGVRRVSLSGMASGPSLNFYEGKSRTTLYIFQSRPRLSMDDEKAGIELSIDPDGGHLTFFRDGEPTFQAP